jgi:hypothetical protein
MTKAEQCREFAEEALRWSRQSKTEEEKKALIDLAVTWAKAAALNDRAREPPHETVLQRPQV